MHQLLGNLFIPIIFLSLISLLFIICCVTKFYKTFKNNNLYEYELEIKDTNNLPA